jgi:hypothetical protein
LAAWAKEDAIQFGGWPESITLEHKPTANGLDCRITTVLGANAAFQIRIDGEKLNVKIPPYLGANVNMDEAVLRGR